MSQVKFETTYKGKAVEVMAGWDRPCQHYYLTVFDMDPDADTEVVWSTLDHPDQAADQQGTVRIRARLNAMLIDTPDEFWERVERNEGNKVHVHMRGEWYERDR